MDRPGAGCGRSARGPSASTSCRRRSIGRRPGPTEMWLRILPSPVPAQTTFGSDVGDRRASRSTAPAARRRAASSSCRRRWSSRCRPTRRRRSRCRGSPGMPAAAEKRLPSGPIVRQCNRLYRSGLGPGRVCAAGATIDTHAASSSHADRLARAIVPPCLPANRDRTRMSSTSRRRNAQVRSRASTPRRGARTALVAQSGGLAASAGFVASEPDSMVIGIK